MLFGNKGWILVLGCVLAFAGCETSQSVLEIEGNYVDQWGNTIAITSDALTLAGMGRYHVAEFDNAANWVVAENDAANEYFPGMWSRFDWTEQAGTLYLCQIAYADESLEAAKDTEAPDASDPANAGCGGFGWTVLTPAE
jgi:hypothetical protein